MGSSRHTSFLQLAYFRAVMIRSDHQVQSCKVGVGSGAQVRNKFLARYGSVLFRLDFAQSDAGVLLASLDHEIGLRCSLVARTAKSIRDVLGRYYAIASHYGACNLQSGCRADQ
jgi:hypothetical protein